MWIPKSKEELSADQKKREKSAMISGLIFSLFVPLVFSFFEKYIGTRGLIGGPLGPTMSWTEILEELPTLFVSGSVGGILIYLTIRKLKDSYSQVCPKCGKLMPYTKDKNLDCECGGKYQFISDLKWIDDNEKVDNPV